MDDYSIYEFTEDDPVTGFERKMRIHHNKYGFFWFLLISTSNESAVNRAVDIMNDLINNPRSRFMFMSWIPI